MSDEYLDYFSDLNSVEQRELHKAEIKALKAIDKFFEKETRKIKYSKTNKKGEENIYYRTKHIDLYGSAGIGHKIRNATNGFYTEDIVGSNNEHNYFVVSDSRGVNGRRDTLTLYFDSPEQYENHCLVTVPQKVKENWHKKFLEMNRNE